MKDSKRLITSPCTRHIGTDQEEQGAILKDAHGAHIFIPLDDLQAIAERLLDIADEYKDENGILY